MPDLVCVYNFLPRNDGEGAFLSLSVEMLVGGIKDTVCFFSSRSLSLFYGECLSFRRSKLTIYGTRGLETQDPLLFNLVICKEFLVGSFRRLVVDFISSEPRAD